MTLADRAQRLIAVVEQSIGDTKPDEAEMRRILRNAGHNFHGGTSWGLKIWRRECKPHLLRHYTVQEGAPPPKPWKAGLPDDIIFPFRESA
jgi:hypothetical protein